MNSHTEQICIFDARSKINAMGNKFKAGGYENTKEYYTFAAI